MSTSTWTGGKSNWADPDNWSPAGVPGAGSDVTIATGDAVASASIGTVNSITDSSYLDFESAGTNTVATFLDDAGHLYVEGGTTLNIGETLANSGYLSIGNATLSAPDTVTAASLDNTGKIYLTGSSADQALLDVAGSAGFGTAGVLSGYVRLAGDSAIEFASGEIASLAKGAHLGLVGNDAFVEDSTALGSNSALTGLASIGAGALFALHDGAAVSTTGALANDGTVVLDTGGGDGGSSLTVGGALTNSQELGIGNGALSASDEVTATSFDNTGKIQLTGSSANQALLDVTGSAGFGTAGILSGYVRLTGDSAIEFGSGQITSLAAKAHLGLIGNEAFIEDSTATGSNSALTGLASISADALFALHDGAAVSTTGALANDGTVALDSISGDGGSSLTLTGALTNSQELGIGNAALSASDEVTATSFDNTGKIQLTGSSANQALLDVTGSAGFGTAGVLSGDVRLAGDSAIEFASGQITSLAASAVLILDGFIEDSAALGSNSALTGLASIGAGATFELGTAVSTTGALVNDGSIEVVLSDLSVSGALTNNGSISLIGALLDVTAGSAGFGTAGVLTGNVDLGDYNLPGGSAIEFASGQITSLAAKAQLQLNGNSAFIEDSTALGSNSALTGLASIGAGATLDLELGAAVSTTGALVNDGTIAINFDYNDGSAGASSLAVGGTLTNNGTLNISIGLLDVTAGSAGFGAAGTLTGNVNLYGSIEFLRGQITTIATGATLDLDYGDAFIEDSTALGSNSALAGLADIAGTLSLDGASVSTTGSLVNDGSVALGPGYGSATSLAVAGTLTNTGTLDIASNTRFSGPSSVTAKSFVNSGTVDLVGYATIFSDLSVSGTTTNNGSISINTDTEELAGAVGGTGSFSLSTANLQFDSSVSSGQTITETGADALTLNEAQSFAATIKGFGTGDTIDATNFLETATSYSFLENSMGTGGTLTLTDTSPSLTANILMTGDYSNKSFTLAHDSGTGTLVKFV